MRCAVLSALLVFAVAVNAHADGKDDVKLLAGTWQATSMQGGKATLPPEQVKELKLFIDGETYKVTLKERETDKGKLAAAKTARGEPKALDIASDVAPEKKLKNMPAIYELDGESLKVCYGLDGKRPKEFKAADEALLIVYKKVK